MTWTPKLRLACRAISASVKCLVLFINKKYVNLCFAMVDFVSSWLQHLHKRIYSLFYNKGLFSKEDIVQQNDMRAPPIAVRRRSMVQPPSECLWSSAGDGFVADSVTYGDGWSRWSVGWVRLSESGFLLVFYTAVTTALNAPLLSYGQADRQTDR